MRKLSAVVLAWAALAAGCASDTESAAELSGEGLNEGGQTGSLIPGHDPAVPGLTLRTASPCSLVGAPGRLVVTEGDVAAVLYPDTAGSSEVRLIDENGDPVDIELESIAGSSAQVVRTEAALAQGEYQLELACNDGTMVRTQTTTVEVASPKDLPETSGTLQPLFEPNATRSCDDDRWYDIVWTPDPALEQYLDLLALTVSLNSGATFTIVDYGQVELSGGSLVFSLPTCPVPGGERCLQPGPTQLQLAALLPGENLQPAPTTLEFQVDCERDRIDGAACAFGSPPARWSMWPIWTSVALALHLARTGQKRRRSRGVEREEH